MQALSSTLLAHQKGAARRPHLLATAHATRAYTPLLGWTRYYTGAENDSPHGVTVADDGGLVRVRNDAGTLFVSRVAAPGPGSTYSTWTNLATIAAGGGVDVDRRVGTQELTIAAAHGTALKTWQSADGGASWTGPTTRVTEASAIGSVAIAYQPSGSGDLAVFYTLGTSTTLKSLRRTGGVWAGAGTTWSRSGSVASLTGLGVDHDGGDFLLAITGTEVTTTHKRVWSAAMGDGGYPAGYWTTPVAIAESDTASTTTFAGPAILSLSSGPQAWYAHKEAGNVAFNRAMHSFTPYLGDPTGVWAEPEPHEAASAFGLAVSQQPDLTGVWAATPSGVWFAPINDIDSLDARVLACTYRMTPTSSRCLLELDNHDGLLNGAPNATYPALMVGGELTIDPGYLSGAAGGEEYGVLTRWSVDAIRFRLSDGKSVAVVECSGPWELAGRLRAPQAWQVAPGVMQRDALFGRLAARAGLAVFAGGLTGDWTTMPGFALAQGESFAAALRRLWEVMPDGILTEQNYLTLKGFSPGDASTYTYGTDHAVSALEISDAPPAANWARLAGPDRYAEDLAASSVYQHGARLQTVRNLDAGTNAKATAWATGLLRRATWGDQAGELVAPLNAGQQLYDVVTVNSAQLGLTAQKYRVVGLGVEYRRGPKGARYDSVLTLGGL